MAVEEVPEDDYMLPLSEAEVRYFLCSCLSEFETEEHALIQVLREGTDITLVGWGAQLSIMEQACVEAAKVNSYC